MQKSSMSLILGLLMLFSAFPLPTLTSVQATPARSADELVSYEAMQPTVQALTTIEAYSGWRSAGTVGEKQAADYLQTQLNAFTFLTENGMTIAQEDFTIYSTQEIWDAQLEVVVDGATVSIPAESPRGDLNDLAKLMQFDTDGTLNDTDPNPLQISQPVVIARTAEEFDQVYSTETIGESILFLHYELIDAAVTPSLKLGPVVTQLLANPPAALVLLTENNPTLQRSHGTDVAEAKALVKADVEGKLPRLMFARLEDFGTTDITTITSATLTLDIDVISPATSQNVIVLIPGQSHEKAVILGASIDSLNTPGALDNASGAAGLLEVARVLNMSEITPPHDVYLVWFGAQEAGFYGSAHFATQHQDLLDRTLGMLHLDGLTAPRPDMRAGIDLMTWNYGRMGYFQNEWANAIKKQAADEYAIPVVVRDLYTVWSANTTFNTFGIPNADITYHNLLAMSTAGSFAHGAMLNNPYDTLEQVDAQAEALVKMVRVAVLASLEISPQQEEFQSFPAARHQMVLIANHTASDIMPTTTIVEFGMAMAVYSYDIDVIPYGAELTAEAIADAELVIALPTYDYGDSAEAAYTEAEATILAEYVNAGGFLILTNSATRLQYNNLPGEINEDSLNMNVLGAPFGVTFLGKASPFNEYNLLVDSPLFDGVELMDVGEATGINFRLDETGTGIVGKSNEDLFIGGVVYGTGSVLVLADYAILGNRTFIPGEPLYENPNLPFWQNFARIPILENN